MEDRSEVIVSEISQVLEQYRQEVPGRRRAMPESIKTRVAELHALGFKSAEVARRTGIPYFTVLKWRHKQKAAGFDVVKVVKSRAVGKVDTVTVPSIPRQGSTNVDTVTEATFSTVSVRLPNGVRIDQVHFDFLLQLIPVLGGVR